MISCDDNNVLMVREHLASGREVVLIYDYKGQPIHGWDVATLSSEWLNDSAWHPAGVAAGIIKKNNHDQTLPVPLATSEADIAPWLASTYSYLSPLLGNFSLPLSSFGLFDNELIEIIRGLPHGSKILEIGGQSISEHLETNGFNSFILSPEAVPSIGVKKYLRGIVENIPVEDSFFNCVICLFVLEHILNPFKAIREMARVLASDGLLILGIPVAQELTGKPPLFHRWQYVFANSPVPHRTIALETLNMSGIELKARNISTWVPNTKRDEACLFLFDKQKREDYA